MLSIYGILPELILFVSMLGIILAEVGYHGERERLITLTSLLGNIAALLQVILLYDSKFDRAFGDVYLVDGLALFFKFLILTLGVLVHCMTIGRDRVYEPRRSEFYILLNGYLLSVCLLVSSGDLFLIFSCALLMLVSGFFLAALSKEKIKGLESGLKFFHGQFLFLVFFIVASALLFEAHGTLSIHNLVEVFSVSLGQLDLLCLGLIYLACMSWITCFPLNLWYVDVAEGSPIPAATVLMLGGACVGFPVVLRIFYPLLIGDGVQVAPMTLSGESWMMNLVMVGSGITMIFGAVQSLRQNSFPRILGNLALAQWGFLQMVFLVYSKGALSALLYGMFVQLFAMVGCFWAYSVIREKSRLRIAGNPDASGDITTLSGSIRWAATETGLLTFFLCCLVGFPMTPAFIGKFAILTEAHAAKQYHIILVALLSMVLCSAAVVRLAFHLLNGKNLDAHQLSLSSNSQNHFNFHRGALIILVLPLIALLIFPDWILGWAAYSLSVILW
jgi:NADH-quinone oxidoreductase subunit N